ncbi:AMP-binding protein, partial [Acrocarpospora corrugata]
MPYADDVAVHQLVEERAARSPLAVAVSCDGQSLTYDQLNARANQLARHLMNHGVTAGRLVAVCMERGVDMMVALLGVLKAGAGYAPLDADYPAERLNFMMRDIRASLLITHSHLRERLDNVGPVPQVLIDHDWSAISAHDSADLPPQAGPDDLAYIIYTSGSTGTPKGVMIQHRSLSNRLQEMARRYELTSEDRTLQFASISFDAAAEQIFPTLMSGGRLLMRGSDNWSPSRVLAEIREQKITVAELTPALWEQVIPHLDSGKEFGGQFRLMVLGGEQVSPVSVNAWFQRTSVPIYNTYGPTEATITATSCYIEKAEEKVL